jgi:hypothetical protein
VVGFLPGYFGEEGLQSGAGFFLWNLLGSVVPLEHVGAAPYLALAAAALFALAVRALFTPADQYLAAAMTLAVGAMVLLSPPTPGTSHGSCHSSVSRLVYRSCI